jgi:hypothetical protein
MCSFMKPTFVQLENTFFDPNLFEWTLLGNLYDLLSKTWGPNANALKNLLYQLNLHQDSAKRKPEELQKIWK